MVELDKRVPVGIIELNESEVEQLDGFVDDLVKEDLLDATFSSRPGEKVHFPGEGCVSHYEMIFSLKGVKQLLRGKWKYGKRSRPAIRVIKRLQNIHEPELGWNIELHRIVLDSQRVVNDYESIDKVRVDVQTGETIAFHERELIDNPRKIKRFKNKLLKQLIRKRNRLVDSKFSMRETGKWYELNK